MYKDKSIRSFGGICLANHYGIDAKGTPASSRSNEPVANFFAPPASHLYFRHITR